MKRRGFVGALLALLAAPAVAWERKRKKRRRAKGAPVGPEVLEFRTDNNFDYVMTQRALGDRPKYWKRRHPTYAAVNGLSYSWSPCARDEFYGAHLHAVRHALPPNYKSPARIWWEAQVRR